MPFNSSSQRKQSLARRKSSYLEIFQPNDYMALIHKSNNELQEYLFNLNQEISKVIQTRESAHLLAYQNHYKRVQEELKKLREKLNTKQQHISKEDIISFLQRQTTIFRNQAMKYFYLLQDKEEQLSLLKRELSICQEQLEISYISKKSLIKKLKLKQANFQEFKPSLENHLSIQGLQEVKRGKKRISSEVLKSHAESKFRKTLLSFDLKESDEFFRRTISKKKQIFEPRQTCGGAGFSSAKTTRQRCRSQQKTVRNQFVKMQERERQQQVQEIAFQPQKQSLQSPYYQNLSLLNLSEGQRTNKCSKERSTCRGWKKAGMKKNYGFHLHFYQQKNKEKTRVHSKQNLVPKVDTQLKQTVEG